MKQIEIKGKRQKDKIDKANEPTKNIIALIFLQTSFFKSIKN